MFKYFNKIKFFVFTGSIFSSLFISDVAIARISGYMELQWRLFPERPLLKTQEHSYLSIAAEPEIYSELIENKASFTFKPFIRLDQWDYRRRHFDIRELNYQHSFENWDFLVGISKVFWGVAESQHLVDIINQTDILEGLDNEDKLGQPMIKIGWENSYALFEFFALPYFRQRVFPGARGRFFSIPRIDHKTPSFESSKGTKHLDLAIRMSKTVGIIDFGLSHFRGTAREPDLIPNTFGGEIVLFPYYPIVNQTGLDAQATFDSWLLKLEAISHRRNKNSHFALVTGFEYTFYGLGESSKDLGLIMEYHFDDRKGANKPLFGNDIMMGARFVFNNSESTEILGGFVFDLDKNSNLWSIEASHRISDNWKINLEVRMFANLKKSEPIYTFRRDSFAELQIQYYF